MTGGEEVELDSVDVSSELDVVEGWRRVNTSVARPLPAARTGSGPRRRGFRGKLGLGFCCFEAASRKADDGLNSLAIELLNGRVPWFGIGRRAGCGRLESLTSSRPSRREIGTDIVYV